MATVKRTLNAVLAPRVESTAGEGRGAPPRLLRCLVVSSTAARRRLIRAAAEQQAWEAIVCRDAGEFLRNAFKRSVPLMIVDLPGEESPSYWALRDATDRAKQMSDALVAVAGVGASEGEELWARKLGVWGYLSEANSQRGFETLLGDARIALVRTGHAREAFAPAQSEDDW